MNREKHDSSAHIDQPIDKDDERVRKEIGITQALDRLGELGVQKMWEEEDQSDIYPGGIEQQVRELLPGQSLEGILPNGEKWKLKRLSNIDYDVEVTPGQEEQGT
ncbi:hypothetical protein ACFL04_02675 [Patescibacteria group bacterium]